MAVLATGVAAGCGAKIWLVPADKSRTETRELTIHPMSERDLRSDRRAAAAPRATADATSPAPPAAEDDERE